MKQAVVIGAGAGGLAAGIRLAVSGWNVEVVEQSEEPGGKLRSFSEGGYRFDAGPSLFTWPALVEELDGLVRAEHPDVPRFDYAELDRSAHYFWPDGKQWVAWADPGRRTEAVDGVWGAGMGARLERYLADSGAAFEATRPLFLESSLHEAQTYSWERMRQVGRQLGRLPLLGTFHRRNAGYDLAPELVQFADRYATYNGSDPMRAPAMLQVIPHLEHGMGTFFPCGGMIAITEHLVRLLDAAGATLTLGTRADRIVHAGGRVQGVETSDGFRRAELVVSNADVAPTYRRLLPDLAAPERTLQRERSTSGLIFYWGMRKEFPSLHLHNLFFSKDYKREFERIQTDGHPGDDPTVYVNITSKLAPNDAPAGCENWFVLINVAADPEAMTEERIGVLRAAVVRQVDRALWKAGDLARDQSIAQWIEVENRLTPADIEGRTSSWKGALYGTSSNSAASAFLRHRNRSTQLRGLYFCGGSVHPGGGIPLCLLSGKIVSELVEQHEPA